MKNVLDLLKTIRKLIQLTLFWKSFKINVLKTLLLRFFIEEIFDNLKN